MSATVSPFPAAATAAELDFPHAFTTAEDIAIDTATGLSASLIYLEADLALYLDEDDTDIALQQVSDRDLHLIAGLVDLAVKRVERELERRIVAEQLADDALAGW